MLSPFIANIFFDSCFDNPHRNNEDQFAYKLLNNKNLNILIAHSNLEEINHPNTPQRTKDKTTNLISTVPNNNLIPSESLLKKKILDVLAGNGKRQNMAKDAEHFFEACKYGSYFITTDDRILLKKRNELYNLGVNCKVMLPSEFYKLVEHFKKLNELEAQIWSLHVERDQYAKNSQEYRALDSKTRKLEGVWTSNQP